MCKNSAYEPKPESYVRDLTRNKYSTSCTILFFGTKSRKIWQPWSRIYRHISNCSVIDERISSLLYYRKQFLNILPNWFSQKTNTCACSQIPFPKEMSRVILFYVLNSEAILHVFTVPVHYAIDINRTTLSTTLNTFFRTVI